MRIYTRLAVVAAALVLAGAVLSATAGTANAATPAISPNAVGTDELVNLAYHQCLTTPNANLNVVLVLYVCIGSDSESWTMVPVVAGSNTFYLVNKLSGLCAEVNNGTNRPGELVDDFYCNGTQAEQWITQYVKTVRGVNYYKFVHYGTNECLDTVGGASSRIMQWTCAGNDAQLW